MYPAHSKTQNSHSLGLRQLQSPLNYHRGRGHVGQLLCELGPCIRKNNNSGLSHQLLRAWLGCEGPVQQTAETLVEHR